MKVHISYPNTRNGVARSLTLCGKDIPNEFVVKEEASHHYLPSSVCGICRKVADKQKNERGERERDMPKYELFFNRRPESLSKFKTSDGSVFKTEEEAAQHQRLVDSFDNGKRFWTEVEKILGLDDFTRRTAFLKLVNDTFCDVFGGKDFELAVDHFDSVKDFCHFLIKMSQISPISMKKIFEILANVPYNKIMIG
jgi:hypothetical protein